MHTLIYSICFSVAVSIFLKLANRKDIHIGQAVLINYVTATALCLWLFNPALDSLLNQSSTSWVILILLGILLPSVFLIMASAVRFAGIVLSDTAQRLSLILPIIAAFVVFGETISSHKLMGVGLALIALLCLIFKPKDKTPNQHESKNISNHLPADSNPHSINSFFEQHQTAAVSLSLLGVWFGYGFIDILFKQMARIGANFISTLLLSFVLAGILLFIYLLLKKTVWNLTSLISGVLLGLLNFSNIYFYIRAHQTYPDNPTLVFAAMNIGVISIGTLVGAGFFREKISWINALGIAIAITAIVVLLPK